MAMMAGSLGTSPPPPKRKQRDDGKNPYILREIGENEEGNKNRQNEGVKSLLKYYRDTLKDTLGWLSHQNVTIHFVTF